MSPTSITGITHITLITGIAGLSEAGIGVGFQAEIQGDEWVGVEQDTGFWFRETSPGSGYVEITTDIAMVATTENGYITGFEVT